MTIGAKLYNEVIFSLSQVNIIYLKKIIKCMGDNKMNTEKYIEIAIFAVITGLLSGTGSYFVNKKIEKLKEKRKKKKINN